MTTPFLLGVLGSLGTLVFVFELLRKRRLQEKYAVLWVTVALGALVITLMPGTLRRVTDLLGIEAPSNLLFFMALLLLLLTNIQQSFEVGRLEEKTRTLAEEVALLRLEIKRPDDTGPDS